MRIYGIDLTSAPRRSKPITCASCRLERGALQVDGVVSLDSFEMLENFLASDGPWIAGLDFPFGQPKRLVLDLGWPQSWEAMVAHAASLGLEGFVAALDGYREGRARGDRHHLRETDALAGARSPMMLHGVPVGRMFFQGAPRLARAGVSVLPCRPNDSSRVAVEAYPALVARRLVGRRSYKLERRGPRDAERRAAREEILRGLGSEVVSAAYGLSVSVHRSLARELLDEPAADQLDALLAALQAAWAWSRRDAGFGIPAAADPVEGWIADPALLAD